MRTFICQFICQKLAFKLANKLRQISRFNSQILTTHLPAFLLPSLEIIFFLRSYSMRYLTTDSAIRVAVHEVHVMYKESKRICVAGEASIPVVRYRDDRGDI